VDWTPARAQCFEHGHKAVDVVHHRNQPLKIELGEDTGIETRLYLARTANSLCHAENKNGSPKPWVLRAA
jgi:hypothetical protein